MHYRLHIRPAWKHGPPLTRNRVLYAMLGVTVVAAGLLWRSGVVPLPQWLSNNGGDALWALMVFVGFGFLLPRPSTMMIALEALGEPGVNVSPDFLFVPGRGTEVKRLAALFGGVGAFFKSHPSFENLRFLAGGPFPEILLHLGVDVLGELSLIRPPPVHGSVNGGNPLADDDHFRRFVRSDDDGMVVAIQREKFDVFVAPFIFAEAMSVMVLKVA